MFNSSEEIILSISKKFKRIRRSKKISQSDLAIRSGVSFGTIKRFESKGEISLHSLVKLCITLNIVDDFKNIII